MAMQTFNKLRRLVLKRNDGDDDDDDDDNDNDDDDNDKYDWSKYTEQYKKSDDGAYQSFHPEHYWIPINYIKNSMYYILHPYFIYIYIYI